MSNQIEPNQLHGAKEWARETLGRGLIQPPIEHCDAAAEVISKLPEVIVDGDELRKLSWKYLAFAEDAEPEGEKGKFRAALYRNFAGILEAFLPAFTPRAEIKLGGRAMHPKFGRVMIVSAYPDEDGEVRILWEDSEAPGGSNWVWVAPDSLSPDDLAEEVRQNNYEAMEATLPRMDGMWVSGKPPVDTEQDSHCESNKSVNDSVNTSHDEPQDGEAWLIEVAGEHLNAVVAGAGFLYVDVIRTWTPAHSVTPICRMVPEQQPRTLTTEQDYKNAEINTVVRNPETGVVFKKHRPGAWTATGRDYFGNEYEMADAPRTVLWEPEVDHG